MSAEIKPSPSFQVSIDLSDGRSTPDDVADALQSLVHYLRAMPGGPIDLRASGDITLASFLADDEFVGTWEVKP